MTPRGLLTTIGATALGIGIVAGGAPAIMGVLAQEATPPAVATPAPAEQAQAFGFEARRAEAYDAFVAALAGDLGSDEAAVDAAIRAALTRQVDEREAAGDLDIEAAAAIRAVIDVSDAPLFPGFGGHGGFDGRHGRGERGGFGSGGPHGGFDDRDGGSPPAAAPGDDDASDQGPPAPSVPVEDIIL